MGLLDVLRSAATGWPPLEPQACLAGVLRYESEFTTTEKETASIA